jgi:hypothetical protein
MRQNPLTTKADFVICINTTASSNTTVVCKYSRCVQQRLMHQRSTGNDTATPEHTMDVASLPDLDSSAFELYLV